MGKNFQKTSKGEKRKHWRGHSTSHARNTRGSFTKTSTDSTKEFVPKVNLKEDQVGITEFVNRNSGFTAVFKARFSDFHVNEIDLDDSVLKLNDLSIPQPPDESVSLEELINMRKELSDVLTQEVWNNIENCINHSESEQKAKHVEIDVTDFDKKKRTQIHRIMKKIYEKKVVSSTVTVNDKKFIQLKRAVGGKGDTDRTKWSFSGEYVHFLVHKENMETSEVASILANNLKMHPSQVNYCGTKDKRGKTTQKFSIKRREPSLIAKAIKNVRSVHIGNFMFKQSVLKLGDLKGNRFRIALRHVNGDIQDIEEILKNTKSDGFINYFGLQRFGNNPSVPTYEVGIALLKCDYKLACELILKPRDNDIPAMREIRQVWWTNRNSTEALGMFPSGRSCIEKKLLDGLSKYGEADYASALRKIPRNMLLLYPHAYQSLIFNKVASRRIKEFGLKIIPGDLVYRNSEEQDVGDIFDADETNDEVCSQSQLKDEVEEKSSFKQKVKSLTEKDINSSKYTMFDIVLPLPGYDITYPDNSIGKYYEEILQESELSSSKLKHNVKTFSMPGAYRKLLIQPKNMSWEFKSYDSPESTLIWSDWEELNGQKSCEKVVNGKYQALLINFCLPPAAYATMLLREILKSDTCAANQTQIERNEVERHSKRKLDDDAVEDDSDKKLKLNNQ